MMINLSSLLMSKNYFTALIWKYILLDKLNQFPESSIGIRIGIVNESEELILGRSQWIVEEKTCNVSNI